MNRRRVTILTGVGLLIVVGLLVLIGSNRRAALARQFPAWLDTRQPPESMAMDMGTVAPAESWAASRPTPLAASCPGYSAGSRVRRTYPPTLADAPYSFIRGNIEGGF